MKKFPLRSAILKTILLAIGISVGVIINVIIIYYLLPNGKEHLARYSKNAFLLWPATLVFLLGAFIAFMRKRLK